MTFHAAEAIDPAQPVTGKYVMHCHNLVHEDHDMMNQFETQPGAATTAPAPTTGTAPAPTKPGGGAKPAVATSTMVQWSLEA